MNQNTKVFWLFSLKNKRLREWFSDLRAEKPGISEFYLMGKLMLKIFLYPRPAFRFVADWFG